LWFGIVVSAVTIACCVSAPTALVVAADLTLSAAAGLGVGLAIVVTACVLRTLARQRPPRLARNRVPHQRIPDRHDRFTRSRDTY
jgi:hypothetical protein